jgi:hypothetical protein
VCSAISTGAGENIFDKTPGDKRRRNSFHLLLFKVNLVRLGRCRFGYTIDLLDRKYVRKIFERHLEY